MNHFVLAFILIYAQTARATVIDCNEILKRVRVEQVGNAYSFDRWDLPPGIHFEAVLEALIEVVPPGRPILIFDTNPNPQIWHRHNIVSPNMDLCFPATGYAQLTALQRNLLFADFAKRIQLKLHGEQKPVIVIDHHFRSHLLSETSTTPLVVDFVNWLNAHPEQHEVCQAFRKGLILRDHSDPDIVLANFALSLLDRPQELRKWGSLIRRIALLNDHAHIDAELSFRERGEVLIGLIMLEAFEKEIPERFPAGYSWALENMASALTWVHETLAAWPVGDADPIGRFLREAAAPPGLETIFASMRAEGEIKRELGVTLRGMFTSGRDVEHRGRSLILHFHQLQPSGLDVLQFLRRNPGYVPEGVKVILTVGKKPVRGVSQVKLRVTDPRFSLDRLFDAIVARGLGGGGRSGAGALYGTSGEVKTENELAKDLAWLTTKIEAL